PAASCSCSLDFSIRKNCILNWFVFLHKTPWPSRKLERKGFIQLKLPHCCDSPKEVRIGTHTRQDLGGRS
ncbi:mCG140641, partial [Mus musculus]